MKQKKTQNPFNQFIGLYPLSKTLRFELRPIGKTKENIISAGILEEDNHRAESYKEVKKIIDEYHKAFIERVLKDLVLEEKPLQAFYECYKKSSNSSTATPITLRKRKGKRHYKRLGTIFALRFPMPLRKILNTAH